MLIRPSHLLTQAELANLQADAQVLEQDERGPKVLLLNDGTMLKIFRPRSKLSRDTLFSNARSFCRNAERIHRFGIPTLTPLALYHFESSSDTGVLYQPLQGETLRQLLNAGRLSTEMCEKLGVFIAKLHAAGIYFRSLHLGNILWTDNNELGLIDLADMNIYWWPLQLHTRIRNFKRIQKYHKDMLLMGQASRTIVMNAYLQHTNFSQKQEQKLLRNIQYQAHLQSEHE